MLFCNRTLWIPTYRHPPDLLSVTVGWFACSRMLYKYNAYSFLVWLFSLKMIILRSIHGMHISRLHSFLLYQYATMCLSIPSLIGIWIASSFGALYSARNVPVQVFEWTCGLLLLGQYLGVGWLAQKRLHLLRNWMLNFERHYQSVFQSGWAILYFSQFPHIIINKRIVSLLNFSQFNMPVVIACSGFNLYLAKD